jgi:DDE superfamily endonuclease/Helix-turn-helix of DDE superfamily endonuclease
MLFYRAALPLSSRTLTFAAGIIRRHRAAIGSPWRKLNPGQQALLALVYLRKGETFAEVAAGFEVGTTTAWRYVNETVALLAARAPKLRKAVRDAKKAGHAYVVLDGTLIPVDRVAADRPFYSGKHRKHGMNLQVIASPDGDILWVSGALPGSVHDKKAEWIWGVLAELKAAGLVTLADKGYQGSAYAKIPYRGRNKPESQKQANKAHAKLRSPGERANAQLKTSSRPGASSASCAAAPGAPDNSPRPSTYCRSARHNQDEKGSLTRPAGGVPGPRTGTERSRACSPASGGSPRPGRDPARGSHRGPGLAAVRGAADPARDRRRGVRRARRPSTRPVPVA